MQKFARIGPIAFHLPKTVEDNDLLQALFPKWDMDLIYRKTGVRARHIAAPGETAADLAVRAVERLFQQHDIDRDSIDFLLFCTQSPDYPLPTTACLLQDRLKLRTSIGALDFNLGCSGFVYGLSMADGLIRSRAAERILLVTAETYSKYIHPTDRSLRTIFGDGAAATLIEAADERLAGRVRLRHRRPRRRHAHGHRGRRPARGRRPETPQAQALAQRPGDGRSGDRQIHAGRRAGDDRAGIERSKWTRDDVEFYLMHQATLFMLEHLRVRLDLTEEQMPLALQEYGNTVSSTLPLLMHDLRAAGRLRPGTQTLLVGFGVGLSWAGCSLTETWQPRNSFSAAEVTEHGGIEQHAEGNRKIPFEAGPNGKHAADAVEAAETT